MSQGNSHLGAPESWSGQMAKLVMGAWCQVSPLLSSRCESLLQLGVKYKDQEMCAPWTSVSPDVGAITFGRDHVAPPSSLV